MQLNRSYQRELLSEMAEVYPDPIRLQPPSEELFETLYIAMSDQADDDRNLSANLAYLEEHGLAKIIRMFRHNSVGRPVSATITAKGLDFLADDGGVSAILGVVTVKIHEETLRRFLLEKIYEEPGSPGMKENLRKTILELPSNILQTVVLKIVDSAINQPGALISYLKDLNH